MTEAAGRRAIEEVWSRLRLVVIDIETAVGPDGHRIISFAAVTCRKDSLGGRFQEFVNPGIPIDPHTMRIHKLTDVRIAHESDFVALAPLIMNLLTPRSGETLVVCAHNTSFDIPVLRAELIRAGSEIPELPLLDTFRGLARVAGLRPKSGKLDALLTKLGLTNFAPHDALGDAVATAEAARLLLNRAATAGLADLDRLIAEAADGTTRSVAFAPPRTRTKKDAVPAAPERPPEHLASHVDILDFHPATSTLTRWGAAADECASLRCDLMVDRVATAVTPPERLLPVLLDALRARARAKDVAGSATLLAGIVPLLSFREPPPGDRAVRRGAVALDAEFSVLLDPLARCGPTDLCPTCRSGGSCPLDVWRLGLAPAALGGTLETQARQFVLTTPSPGRTQPWLTMRQSGHTALADATLRLVHRYWREIGQLARADQVADLAWLAGCRDPEIAEAHAIVLSAGGREADLEAAAFVCAATLPERRGSTDEAWHLLAIREAQILGQIQRRRVRLSDKLDEDGKPIPIRRHHPERPHRMRPPRFLRRFTVDLVDGRAAD